MNDKLELDTHMLKKVALQFALLFLLLSMSDMLIDTVLGLIDLLFELTHLVIETIEYAIELLMEETLHTDHFQSQVILVYGGVFVGLYGLFRLIKGFPQFFCQFKENLLAKWGAFKEGKIVFWHSLTLAQKFKLVGAYCLGSTCLLFFLTL